MDEEQKILEIQDNASNLADVVSGASPSAALTAVELAQMITQDIMWLIKKIRERENEKNQYKEQLQLALGEKNFD